MDENKTMRTFLVGLGFGLILALSFVTGAGAERIKRMGFLDTLLPTNSVSGVVGGKQEIVDQESVVTKVVSDSTPSVVTISISKTATSPQDVFGGGNFDFFGNMFGIPRQMMPDATPAPSKPQDIGTGFVISADGLIVTNKHVVADTTAKYKVVTYDNTVLDVVNIYRDPVNDLAILKVNKTGLTPLPLGDSDKIKVGQTAIAIGTALGEFRSTVTTGVISGLGRGIEAGSPFEGSEQLSNVIQTSAAINPGNSGGPLLNSSGQVVGVNVAVSQSAQNIGFALPINMVKDSITNFKTTGGFERPFLGVSYQMITKQSALLNSVPQGALVQDVVAGSAAEAAGIKQNDIITEADGKKLDDTTSLADLVNKKKLGETMVLKIYRDTSTITVTVKLDKKR